VIEFLKPNLKFFPEEDNTRNEGRFTLEPLAKGYGSTLGNALRRIMITSMPGACISSVRIDGVLHEYQALEGVLEDATDVLLNLKKVVFRSHVERPVHLTLEVKGPKVVTAGDIGKNTDVEVIDPNQYICEITGSRDLRMELSVEKGVGYQLAIKNTKGEFPLNTMFLDRNFSPVLLANYEVEDSRVGQSIDYDKLTFYVKTNGAILPEESIKLAAKMLACHLDLLVAFEITEEVKEEDFQLVQEKTEERTKALDIPIKDLEFSVRSRNCLEQENMRTLGELADKRASELLAIKNFGKKSLYEVREKLAQYGLSLKDEEGPGAKV
jgi:DNA-directed RNA polymerase subunit alpha